MPIIQMEKLRPRETNHSALPKPRDTTYLFILPDP